MKLKGFAMSFDGDKTKCSFCNRTHGRSFVVEDDEGKRLHLGSGCVQKAGIDRKELASTLSKVTVQMARLSYEMIKEDLL